ncbi:hypothetical protein CsSME_00043880 [Camellia sinensis var. sinensis]
MASTSNPPLQRKGISLEEGSGENEDTSNMCLIGKNLGSKILNRTAVSNIIRGAWRIRGELSISPWNDNVYLFQFSDGDDRNRVLRDCPWSVMGKLLALQPLQTGQTVEEMEFRWCSFWVQVHGLPLNNLTKQNGEILGNRIGRSVQVETHTEGLLLYRNFLRIRVEIDTQQPLPRGLWLQRSKEGGES